MTNFKKFLAISLIGTIAGSQSAFAVLIAHWNFNDLTNVTGVGPSNWNQTTYNSLESNATLDLVDSWSSRSGGTSPNGISNFSGTTVNQVGSEVSGRALALEASNASSGTPNNGKSAVLHFNLTGYINPILTFATQRTSTGFNSNQVSYSTDGTSYTNFGSAYNPATAFAVQTVDLSTVNALDNAASVYIKITFSGATGSSGNNRLDNIQMNASPVPEPASFAAIGFGVIAILARRRKNS